MRQSQETLTKTFKFTINGFRTYQVIVKENTLEYENALSI